MLEEYSHHGLRFVDRKHIQRTYDTQPPPPKNIEEGFLLSVLMTLKDLEVCNRKASWVGGMI